MARDYWWLVTTNAAGDRFLVFGSGVSESDARQRGIELLNGLDFEIKKYPTRVQATASSLLRGKRLEQTHSLSEASKRLKHEKSLKRLRTHKR